MYDVLITVTLALRGYCAAVIGLAEVSTGLNSAG